MRSISARFLYSALLFALVTLSCASLIAGKVWVPWSAWFAVNDDPLWVIILELRIPRTILGVAVGFALGVSGAALQGYTRNPLADPGVLGVSALAALGAVMTLFFGVTISSPWLLPLGAMTGAIGGVAVLLLLAGATSSVLTFILAGAILNTVASAGVALALSLSPNPWALNEIVNWLMGSLVDRSNSDVFISIPLIALGCGLLMMTARALDALTLGDMGARSLGVNLAATRLLLALGVGLATGASVAATGVIGFVGLVTPHLMRPLVGARPGALLIPSGLAGTVLVLAADIIVRLMPSVVEIKLGVAMAVLGGPFFLGLLLVLRRRLG
ncbi:MAG: iron ABC transporter permease [Alphaproteobacteria bacterium]|nr:iron ABC transporter permease [Alphaproteobacteria bacterium]PHY00657.1 MAG: ABC transporter permease [Rhodospirillaceae bacterium]